MPCDFDTWNTRENFLSQNPRKASQERFLLVYLVFTCYWRQICYTQLSKPSPKLRSWAPLLVYDATVLTNFPLKLSMMRFLDQIVALSGLKLNISWFIYLSNSTATIIMIKSGGSDNLWSQLVSVNNNNNLSN